MCKLILWNLRLLKALSLIKFKQMVGHLPCHFEWLSLNSGSAGLSDAFRWARRERLAVSQLWFSTFRTSIKESWFKTTKIQLLLRLRFIFEKFIAFFFMNLWCPLHPNWIEPSINFGRDCSYSTCKRFPTKVKCFRWRWKNMSVNCKVSRNKSAKLSMLFIQWDPMSANCK